MGVIISVQTQWHEQDIVLESRYHQWNQAGDGEETRTYTEELLLSLSDQHVINRFRETNEEEQMAVVHKAFENVRPRVPPPRFGEQRQKRPSAPTNSWYTGSGWPAWTWILPWARREHFENSLYKILGAFTPKTTSATSTGRTPTGTSDQ